MPLPADALTLSEAQFAKRYPERYARMRAAGVSFPDYIAAHARLLAARLPVLPATPVITTYREPGMPPMTLDSSAARRTAGAPVTPHTRQRRVQGRRRASRDGRRGA